MRSDFGFANSQIHTEELIIKRICLFSTLNKTT
jgi:hypothetical protein